MCKLKSTALVILSAALSAQSLYAQGQSSGEDTQRRDQQQQKPNQYSSGSSQSSQSAQSSGSSAQSSTGSSQSSQYNRGTASGGSSSSGAPGQSSSSATQSSQYSSTTQPSQSSATGQPSQPNDAFKSDTSTSGRISSQGSSSQSSSGLGSTSSSSQGAPGSGQSSTSVSSSASGRPGELQAGANVQVNQQHVTQFQNVFSNWRPGANQEAQLTAAINAAAPNARINHEYVTRFVTDMNTIIPRVHLTTIAQQRLATAFATVLTPTVQVTTLEPTLTEVRQVLVESGLSPIQAQTVACDLHLMAAQVHPDLLEIQVK